MRAFIFPGQGSQYSGMASDFSKYESWDEYAQKANEVLGFSITEIMDGDEETLKLTENAQPAIYLASYVAYVEIFKKGIEPEYVAGHSLGEYTALAAAGVYDFETGIYLVRKRGEYISQAIEPGKGSMAAVIGVSAEELEELVKKYEGLYIANYNSNEQTVVSGKAESIKSFVINLTEQGKRAMELKVSGPFHTPYLDSAREKMAKEIEHIKFNKPKYPIVMNSVAKEISDPHQIKHYVLEQISGPVYWKQSIDRMLELGVEEFIELGPKNVLSSMLKKAKFNAKHFTAVVQEGVLDGK
ncbi:ACP S-malonyltransferase [Fervidobacterium riparium]|uniref:ACP S-malonyltransferase n=1 Tax=Fervidobacterium gondwanense TaxID=44754 RepID=UPI000934C008|nr:ACP S-malonyltransferase [Fervidobacterium gondwanense]UXF00917.1 malonyl CoA-ACP transacylase [Fervidobacterium riparium]